jgi:hypothetical protein
MSVGIIVFLEYINQSCEVERFDTFADFETRLRQLATTFLEIIKENNDDEMSFDKVNEEYKKIVDIHGLIIFVSNYGWHCQQVLKIIIGENMIITE